MGKPSAFQKLGIEKIVYKPKNKENRKTIGGNNVGTKIEIYKQEYKPITKKDKTEPEKLVVVKNDLSTR